MNVAQSAPRFQAPFWAQSPLTRFKYDNPNRQKVITLEMYMLDFAHNCTPVLVYIMCATAARDLVVNEL